MIIRPKPEVPISTARSGVTDLILFPVYQTREDWATQFGSEPPSADPNRRAKYWFDPDYAGVRPEDDDGEAVGYDTLLIHPLTGVVAKDVNGNPRIGKIWMSKWEAGSVNIPSGISNEFHPATIIARQQPWPPPLRPLHPDERLEFGFGGVVYVRNINIRELRVGTDGFTESDRQLLHAIARKLGL